jgi:hypothetical protein
MSKNKPNADKTETIVNILGDSFLRIAKSLRELQDNHPELFLKAAELAGIGRRKAFALTRIARQFEGVSEQRLHLIGWTKLMVVGRYLTEVNREHLLELAEQNTTHDLEVVLQGETPVEDARIVRFYLAPADYKRLRAVLTKHGAVPSGNGLTNMEAAMMALVAKVEAGA